MLARTGPEECVVFATTHLRMRPVPGPSQLQAGSRTGSERPSAGPGGDDSDTKRRREGGIATEQRQRAKRPQRWKVILYNDDYTPMEFVVAILERIFDKPPAEATQIMLRIHNGGQGIAGVYIQEVAETKVTQVHRLAEERGYPLRSGLEQE